MNFKILTRELLLQEAKSFAAAESCHKEESLYGVTDGKAVGTYCEHKFISQLKKQYQLTGGTLRKVLIFPLST